MKRRRANVGTYDLIISYRDDEKYIKQTLIDLYSAVLITLCGAFTVFHLSMVHALIKVINIT